MTTLLSDADTYSFLSRDHTASLERKSNNLVSSLYNKGCITDIQCSKLIRHNAIAPRIYGTYPIRIGSDLSVLTNILKLLFEEILSFVLHNGYFIYGDKVVKQINGLAMGDPLSPVTSTTYIGNTTSKSERNFKLCSHETTLAYKNPTSMRKFVFSKIKNKVANLQQSNLVY